MKFRRIRSALKKIAPEKKRSWSKFRDEYRKKPLLCDVIRPFTCHIRHRSYLILFNARGLRHVVSARREMPNAGPNPTPTWDSLAQERKNSKGRTLVYITYWVPVFEETQAPTAVIE